jgi:hypothetical protein
MSIHIVRNQLGTFGVITIRQLLGSLPFDDAEEIVRMPGAVGKLALSPSSFAAGTVSFPLADIIFSIF